MKLRVILAVMVIASLMALRSVFVPDTLAQTGVITRGPYLQNVTPTSIMIVWETDQPTDSVVNYGLTTEYGSITSNVTFTTRHVITLEGLNPYTTYHYLVGNSTDNLSADSTLKTAASANQTSFSFAVYGDCRTRIAEHQSVVDSIISVNPDFCINTGDLV
ncbi:MAG: hypothetical protein DRI01_04610 [Chloroflexi bacterium]|nr:MAG: hypothetical protein DRI01_04610 [Chloroflexota bacterium]